MFTNIKNKKFCDNWGIKMKSLKSNMTYGLQKGSLVPTCDNSGAKLIRIISIVNSQQKQSKVQNSKLLRNKPNGLK